MSSSNYECMQCGEVTFHGNLDADEKCPCCGGDTQMAYTTSGAWDDPDSEKRDWDANH